MMPRQPMRSHLILSCRAAAIVLSIASVQGCVPALLLAEAALSGLGDAPAVSAPGPFNGAPSSSQNRSPSDPTIRDALAAAESETVTQECKANLPAVEPEPTTGCVIRWSCLPGLSAPIRLRSCAENSQASQPLYNRPYEGSWRWDAANRAETVHADEFQLPTSSSGD